MKHDFLTELLTNANRAKILRTLILNENERFTPKSAGKRAGIPAGAAEEELVALTKLEVVRRSKMAIESAKKDKPEKQTVWTLNPSFKYIRALSVFVREISPMRYDDIIDTLKPSGRLSTVVLSGSFMGDPSRPADLIIAADPLNMKKLEGAISELEPLFGTELRYAAFTTPEFRYRLTVQDRLIRDTLDFPHLVLMDKSGML